MLVFSVLLAGCVDESGGSSEYSSNAQAQNVYVPQHYNNLLSSDSYQFSAQHYNNLLDDNTYSVSAGEYEDVPLYLDPEGKNNYMVYGTMTETTKSTDGVRFIVQGPGDTVYVDTRDEVRSYSFSFHPTEAGTYYFYLDNRKSWFTNKLPKLKVYEEYDQYEEYKEIPISITPKGDNYIVRGTITVNSGVYGVEFGVSDDNNVFVDSVNNYNINLENDDTYSFEFTPTKAGAYHFVILNKNQGDNPFKLTIYEEYDQ
jgi:hypothetical protein